MITNSITANFNPYVNTGYTSQQLDKEGSAVSKNQNSTEDTSEENSKESSSTQEKTLTEAEEKVVEKLKSRDLEVKNHEMAHVAAGGQYVKRGANYQYQKGPDGVLYAIGGDVIIDTSPVAGDPQATIQKMQTIRSAALAPASPSGADRAIASRASTVIIKAQEELIKLQLEKSGIEKSSRNYADSAASEYGKEDLTEEKGGNLNITA